MLKENTNLNTRILKENCYLAADVADPFCPEFNVCWCL